MSATSEIAQQAGSSRLTIDAVAKLSGVSKGGVLYHYPTKHALIEGLLEFSIEQLDSRVSRHAEGVSGNYSRIKSLIHASAATPTDELTLPLSVLTAAAEHHSLLAPVQEYSRGWFSDVEAEGDMATILLLAVEGLQFLEMLKLLELSPKKRQAIFNAMLKALDIPSD